MARRIKTPLEKLDTAIAKVLAEYEDDVTEAADEIAEKMARRGATALRQESQQDFKSHNPKRPYYKGWTVTVDKQRLYTTAIIHNTTPGLPHLLEHGHLMRNGRRWTPPQQHIEPVETELIQQFEREVQSKL